MTREQVFDRLQDVVLTSWYFAAMVALIILVMVLLKTKGK